MYPEELDPNGWDVAVYGAIYLPTALCVVLLGRMVCLLGDSGPAGGITREACAWCDRKKAKQTMYSSSRGGWVVHTRQSVGAGVACGEEVEQDYCTYEMRAS